MGEDGEQSKDVGSLLLNLAPSCKESELGIWEVGAGGEFQKAWWQGGKSLDSNGKPSKSLGLDISIPTLTPGSQILLTFCTCSEQSPVQPPFLRVFLL